MPNFGESYYIMFVHYRNLMYNVKYVKVLNIFSDCIATTMKCSNTAVPANIYFLDLIQHIIYQLYFKTKLRLHTI